MVFGGQQAKLCQGSGTWCALHPGFGRVVCSQCNSSWSDEGAVCCWGLRIRLLCHSRSLAALLVLAVSMPCSWPAIPPGDVQPLKHVHMTLTQTQNVLPSRAQIQSDLLQPSGAGTEQPACQYSFSVISCTPSGLARECTWKQ